MMPANSNGSVNSLWGVSNVVATVAAATKDGADGGGRLGNQKPRRIETCPYYRTMTMHHHHHHRPFPSSSPSSGISDDGGGPHIRGDVYHDAAIALDRGGRNMAATALGMFPFTGDQLKELQRQAIIYNYMVAALPVPPHLFPGLLLPEDLSPPPPTAASPSSSHHLGMKGSSILGFRFESLDKGGTDPEPWRCKRTDGKKWRCSKDVAPNQKYCDRHMHRGRARSRKPVELNTTPPPPPPPPSAVQLPPIPDRSHPKSSPFEFPDAFASAPFSSGSYKDYTTSLDWVMKQGAANIFDQRSSFFDKSGDSILNDFQDFVKQRQRDACGLFLNLDPSATERPLPERGFIDAWSDSIPEEPAAAVSVDKSQSRMSSLSNLTLSIAMAGGSRDDIIDQDMGPIHIGFGAGDMDRSKNVSGWRSPGSWAAPTPGGPLAEALKRPVSVPRGVTRAADRCGETGGQPAAAASSPSGVLHRGVGSVSDSSDSSSPYLAALTETKHDEVLPSRG